jgi:hypothetical protein
MLFYIVRRFKNRDELVRAGLFFQNELHAGEEEDRQFAVFLQVNADGAQGLDEVVANCIRRNFQSGADLLIV